ncbi:Uncharacterised protein [Vibrio cholerae]|uniref:Uncharacterized protein n=1 Tax=Vibrio cholerae TaxID=666 RepID=A0A655YUS0_VIBCL|nr:Uncharacterised protein [Vibrio cholerae]CRZ64935.1 Uncharacterised protein [Vibrio cholerae]CSA54584.1 Uncharacterised protein [Vibrio cholerae]CSB18933.1 Uncharacterised protein [Vibrio cholerae]CSB22591.1 Uncharacterised protein [Vibrio cholerae]
MVQHQHGGGYVCDNFSGSVFSNSWLDLYALSAETFNTTA